MSDRHDPEKLHNIAAETMQAFGEVCNEEGVCEFHAQLVMQAMMFDNVSTTVSGNNGHPEAMVMLDEQIRRLEHSLKIFKEERARWQGKTRSTLH